MKLMSLAAVYLVLASSTVVAQSRLSTAPLAPIDKSTAATPPASRVGISPLSPSRITITITALAASRTRVESVASSEASITSTLKSELGAQETERGTLVSLPGDVLFDFDQWSIRRDAQRTLVKLAELIRRSPEVPVLIEGHTDAKGSEAYNLELSRKRARSVARWLIEQDGIAPGRLQEVGLGESRPISPNAHPDGRDDPEGRQRNRRVEVILLSNDQRRQEH